MKAIVLCAGEGTRLRPLTYTGAKHLIPLANKPVIYHIIEAIKGAGIEEIGIVVSPGMEVEFAQHLSNGNKWGVNISYIWQREPRGLAHAVACAREFVKDEPFLVYLGDNLLEVGIEEPVRRFIEEDSEALILLTEVEDPRQFGVARLDDEKIVELVEKPVDPPSNLAVIGAYLFHPQIFEAIAKIKPSFRGELEITDAIQRLIDEGYKVSPYLIRGWWKDVGRPEEMLHANQLLLEKIETRVEGKLDEDSAKRKRGRMVIEEGTKVEHSVLRGPLIIGRDAMIEDSFIGPFTSIGAGVRIKKSEIECSIVMEGAKIENAGRRIDNSLIGRDVVINRKDGLPQTYSFVLGDSSQVRLL